MILGPVLDVAREPRWGRVEEDFGEDPYLTGVLGAAYVAGMQGESLATDHSVISEPKHFAGHGSPEGGLNTAPVHAGEREVRTIMLRSFEPAIRQSHAMGAMAAYHEIDGIPVTANPWLLTSVLRQEWGFRGFVLSDLGAIRLLYDTHHVAATPGDAVRMALTAGVDMQFYDFDHDTFQNAIIQGIAQGRLSPTVLDQAVSRVLRAKFALGLSRMRSFRASRRAGCRRLCWTRPFHAFCEPSSPWACSTILSLIHSFPPASAAARRI